MKTRPPFPEVETSGFENTSLLQTMERYDCLEVYCPQLGMLLTFGYCRRSQGALPCRNLVGCWQERIPVKAFLQEHFSQEALNGLLGGHPKTRLERILESIEHVHPACPSEKDS